MNWLWLIAGTVMVLAEFIIPGFVICFFGGAAFIVGGLLWIFPALSLVWQLLIFACAGIILLICCRRFMPGVFRGAETNPVMDVDADGVAGENCVCTLQITPGVPGKVEFRGSLWNASADEVIEPGCNCIVVSRNNLTLKVRKSE